MAYFRKRNGKWKVEINKPNFPRLSKTFLDKATARKWARDVEGRMDRNIYEDFSNAESTTLKDLIIKYELHKSSGLSRIPLLTKTYKFFKHAFLIG